MDHMRSPATTGVQQRAKRDPVAIILRMHIRGNAPLTDTLHHISHKIKGASQAEKEGTEGALSSGWTLVFGIALELPPDGQARLVSFLVHSNHHAKPDLPADAWTNLDERGTFAYGPVDREWASCRQTALVLYSAAVREVKVGMSQSHASNLVNLSACLARLTEVDLVDFRSIACMAMSEVRKCLESKITPANTTMVSAVISGAAVWIIYASHRLSRMARQDNNRFAMKEEHGELRNISPQDWVQWRDDLQQVETMRGIFNQATTHAREALKSLAAADSDGSEQPVGLSKGRAKGCECMMPCSWFMANLMAERKIPQGARGRAREV